MGSMGLIMPQILFFFLLCTFCYPSIATDNFILKLDGLSSRNASYEVFSTGVSTPATLPIFSFEEIGLSYTLPPPPPQALTETSYGDLSIVLWEKISLDFLRLCSGAWMFLVLCCKAIESFTIEWSFYLTGLILDLVAFIWWKILCALFNGLYKLITNFAMQFLTICILAAVTAIIWKGLRWICGNLPMFLLTFPLKIIWKVLWCRPSSPREFKNEKAVDGYISIPITMSPPSNSIVEIIYEGSEAHAGYATCVKLHNGHNGLLTSSHIFTSNGKYAVRSLRESSKGATIGIKDFVVKYQSDHHDITIFTGPPSWESRLGCGAANIMTADRITRGEVCYYTHSFGKWRRYNAKLTGNYFNLATVLSNTEAGDSGSAYWYGKSVLGVHKGCTLDERDNFNLMAPIPNIPGLTSSKLVFETSSPQGKIFDDWAKIQEEYEELLEDLSGTEAISVMKKRRPELFRDELKSLVVALKGEFTPVDALIANNFMEKCAEIIDTDHERIELNYIPNWEFSDEAKPPPTMKTDVDYIRRELEVMHAVNKKQQDLADNFMRQNLDLMKAMKTPPAPFVHEAKPEVSGNGQRGADRETTGNTPNKSKEIIFGTVDPVKATVVATPSPSPVRRKASSKGMPEISSSPSTDAPTGSNTIVADALKLIVSQAVSQLNMKELQTKIAEIAASQLKKPRQGKRGKNGGNKKQTKSPPTSPPSTTGAYQPPHVRSPGSVTSETCPSSTTPNRKQPQSGGKGSSSSTQNWRRKPKASAGPSLGPKQS
uniref:P1 protein n=1 Tax=Cnidium polerovirus 1 TaxID=3019006 RepID=A0AA51X329_9VIRU|nr:MAG: P1 protein [Cnidium polerovirus 1]